MDKDKFIESFDNPHIREIVGFCFVQKDWFQFDRALTFAECVYKKRYPTGTTGLTRRGRGVLLHLIKIGFLTVDPIKGLKVNESFVPLSQQ